MKRKTARAAACRAHDKSRSSPAQRGEPTTVWRGRSPKPGAMVYCTGRSVKGKPSPYRRPETIDETAAMITAGGGKAIAVRVDHTNEAEVKALVPANHRAPGSDIDIVVDSVAGEDPLLLKQHGFLWQADLPKAEAMYRQGLTSRIITAKHAALR